MESNDEVHATDNENPDEEYVLEEEEDEEYNEEIDNEELQALDEEGKTNPNHAPEANEEETDSDNEDDEDDEDEADILYNEEIEDDVQPRRSGRNTRETERLEPTMHGQSYAQVMKRTRKHIKDK